MYSSIRRARDKARARAYAAFREAKRGGSMSALYQGQALMGQAARLNEAMRRAGQ
jgi:hypothetical protein